MKIAYFSDLHLRHWHEREGQKAVELIVDSINRQLDDADIIINAGDSEYSLKNYFDIHRKDIPYIEINGNHDYYSQSIKELEADNPKTFKIKNIKIAATTLWTDLNNSHTAQLLFSKFSDKKSINGLTVDIWQKTFEKHIDFLKNSEADIIVTHHSPFTESISERYLNDAYNCFYTSNLSNKIKNFKKTPKHWIHGHLHANCNYEIDNLKVHCNPFGYTHERQHRHFEVRFINM